MERRKFLAGVGAAAAGGSALVGSGAFTRVESQRDVTIQIADDPNAYLGLDDCYLDTTGDGNRDSASANSSFVSLDGDGHLQIDMGDSGNGGTGVNSDSHSWFDNMFMICNQGKQAAGVWLDVPDAGTWTNPDTGEDEQRVLFYYLDGDGNRVPIESENSFVELGLGECLCVGLRTVTKDLGNQDSPLLDDEVVIHADADLV